MDWAYQFASMNVLIYGTKVKKNRRNSMKLFTISVFLLFWEGGDSDSGDGSEGNAATHTHTHT